MYIFSQYNSQYILCRSVDHIEIMKSFKHLKVFTNIRTTMFSFIKYNLPISQDLPPALTVTTAPCHVWAATCHG